MPRKVSKLITDLENLNIKIQNTLEDHGISDEEVHILVGEAIDTLQDINDELDSQMEDEQI